MAKTDVIKAELNKALKARQADKVSTLRMLVAALHNSWIAKGQTLTDTDADAVLAKEAKKRQEAIEMYKQANRPELVEKETKELELIQAYLPKQLSEAEIRQLVLKIKQNGEAHDFGVVMGKVMGEVKGRADGKLVAEIVKQEL